MAKSVTHQTDGMPSGEVMPSELEARIRARAYEIWEREGHPHGQSDDHWYQAVTQVAAELKKASTNKATPKASNDVSEDPAKPRKAVRSGKTSA